ncbi:unnamed protein product [Orchesella dallaii]|uniref:Uncharacterized protein n=1 Tax=Orchesella dallaii TaxID=48710 RepID=A0ABP1R6R6_9HEXA
MEEPNSYVAWAELKITLVNSFQTSNIEFVWEERNQVTTSAFFQCILIPCVMLNYEIVSLEKSLNYTRSATIESEFLIAGPSFKYIFRKNFNVIIAQRYSSKELLLISDSTFQKSKWGNQALQGDFRNNVKPITIPTVIIQATAKLLKKCKNCPKKLVSLQMSTALLIFVDSQTTLVGIGCFTCERNTIFESASKTSIHCNICHQVFTISFQRIPKREKISYKNLVSFWLELHRNLHFDDGSAIKKQNCVQLNSYREGNEAETCITYETFIEYENCSDYENCKDLYKFEMGVQRKLVSIHNDFKYITQYYPVGQNQIDFSFQILFPKVKLLDANLSAFLTPFNYDAWISTIIAIAITSAWFVLANKVSPQKVIFWQISIIFEQDADILLESRFLNKATAIVWVFCVISLRNFYNSSLYSFISAEKQPHDYPRTLAQLLDREDFSIFVPMDLHDELYTKLSEKFEYDMSEKVVQTYAKFLHKSFYMQYGWYSETVKNAVDGIHTKVSYYSKSGSPESISFSGWIDSSPAWISDEQILFDKFSTICKENCESEWNVALFGQTRLHRIIPKQEPFYSYLELWSQMNPTVASLRFPMYLGRFVQSGLYSLSINRVKRLQVLKQLQDFNRFRKLGMSNGSLFSYVFVSDIIKEHEKVEPTKITAFLGTFVLVGFVFLAAISVLMCELLVKRWCK